MRSISHLVVAALLATPSYSSYIPLSKRCDGHSTHITGPDGSTSTTSIDIVPSPSSSRPPFVWPRPMSSGAVPKPSTSGNGPSSPIPQSSNLPVPVPSNSASGAPGLTSSPSPGGSETSAASPSVTLPGIPQPSSNPSSTPHGGSAGSSVSSSGHAQGPFPSDGPSNNPASPSSLMPGVSETPSASLPLGTPSSIPKPSSNTGSFSQGGSVGPSANPTVSGQEPLPSTASPSDLPSGGTISDTPSTVYPTATVSISTVAGITTDSHTSTIGSDHHTTFIPIVGGSHCWVWEFYVFNPMLNSMLTKRNLFQFCPPDSGSNGFGLIGMGHPGTYPPGPPPPGFPSSLPVITVGPNGDPTYTDKPPEPTPTDQSSSSCSSTEIPSCTASTSYGVDTAGTTTTTFTSTICSTITACTGSATTSTTVTTSSDSPSCYRLPVETASATPTAFVKRGINATQEPENPLVRRAKGRESGMVAFGSCQLRLRNDEPVKFPQYPGPSKILNAFQAQLKGAYIVPVTENRCQAPELTLFPDWDKLSEQTHYDEEERKYSPIGVNNPPFVNTEHVCGYCNWTY